MPLKNKLNQSFYVLLFTLYEWKSPQYFFPVRYSGLFLKWTREELQQMNQRTRKLMPMHKALHPRDNVDRLYVSRKEGERGLTSIENTIDASIQWVEEYIKKVQRKIYYRDQKQYKQRKHQRDKNKQLYGYFKRQTRILIRENLDMAKKEKP